MLKEVNTPGIQTSIAKWCMVKLNAIAELDNNFIANFGK